MPKGTLYVWAVPLLALGLFFRQIHIYWDPDSHYFYGWAVPFMVGYLIWNRINTAQSPTPPRPGLFLIVIFLGLLAAFIRLLWDATPHWYPLSWFHGFALIAFSLSWFAMWRGWRWSFHFLFPLCFVLAALVWPTHIEAPITLWLTERIANIVTVSLQILGIPAVLEGALISIGETTVEVAEACSGIRSLQLLLVTALFLGDYGHFSTGKRFFLILCGLAAAFVQNAARALALGWITGIEGQEAYEKWHDPTGMITVTAGLGLLFAAFLMLEKSAPPEPNDDLQDQKRAPCFCLALSTIAIALLLVVELFSFVWMRLPTDEKFTHWKLDTDALEQMPLHRKKVPASGIYETLETYDVYFGEYSQNGRPISYYNIEWPEGYPITLVNYHTPSTCMGRYGRLIEIAERGFHRLEKDFGGIGYETYLFEEPLSGQMVFVFRSLMTHERVQSLNSEISKRQDAIHGKALLDRWASRLSIAVYKFLNRVGNHLQTNQLILLSVKVDSFEEADRLTQDPAPLKDFVTKLLVEVRP